MHCNLRPPDAAPALIRCKYDAHAKFKLAHLIRCRLMAFFTVDTLRYVVSLTYYSVTLTFDL